MDTIRVTAMKRFGAALCMVILTACGRASFQNSQRAGLEDFIEGANAVAIGMTEAEVSQALGAQPEVRKGNEVVWHLDNRTHPGYASGGFANGYLSGIEFKADLNSPAPPRIDKAAADALTNKEVALRAINKQLAIAEVMSTAGGRGRLASWVLTMGQGNSTRTISTWVWEINPGGKLLVVSEEGGKASQPDVRAMKH
jgi:hypothetical protein